MKPAAPLLAENSRKQRIVRPVRGTKSERIRLDKVRVFSGEESFETTSNVVEEPGKWFAPHIASLITSGGRLLLGMLERCIADAGGTFLFCDTDSAAIVSC